MHRSRILCLGHFGDHARDQTRGFGATLTSIGRLACFASVTEDGLTHVLLGRSFARAYFTVLARES